MSIQQRVIRENNLAVAMIEEAAYDEASSKLCAAFKAYQNCGENDGVHNYKSSVSLDDCMAKGHPMSSTVDPDFPFMYWDVIRISPQIAAAGIRNHDVASIILFNLALSYHLSALDSMEPDADLEKALHVYEHVYSMQQENNQENFLSNITFVLSLLNNIGIVHQSRNDDAIAARCFDKLFSALVMISNNIQSTDRKREEDVFRGFYRNITLVNRPPCASAA